MLHNYYDDYGLLHPNYRFKLFLFIFNRTRNVEASTSTKKRFKLVSLVFDRGLYFLSVPLQLLLTRPLGEFPLSRLVSAAVVVTASFPWIKASIVVSTQEAPEERPLGGEDSFIVSARGRTLLKVL